MMKLDCYFLTDVGKVRKNNEDNFYLNGSYKRLTEDLAYAKSCVLRKDGMFAVCDGMGGEAFGEKAALQAVEMLHVYKRKDMDEYIDEYVNAANEKICDMIMENNGVRSGTTLALLCIKTGAATCYNVGDSRVYLVRRNEIRQLSEDHTRCMQLVKMGVLTEEQALRHKDRHVLTQHMGIFPDELIIQAHKEGPIDIEDGDVFLLCSDGLTDMLSNDEIAQILSEDVPAKEHAEALVEAALSKGGKDNVTVGIVKSTVKREGLFKRIRGEKR